MAFNVSVSFRLDQTRIRRLLRLPGGPVDRDLRKRLARAQAVAQSRAPGTMAAGIRTSVRYAHAGPVGTVTSTHPATIFVVNGTRPHVIWPKINRPNPHLRFTVGGRVVYARVVFHPGTRANPFLRDALRAAI
jgi:hypothetical protein